MKLHFTLNYIKNFKLSIFIIGIPNNILLQLIIQYTQYIYPITCNVLLIIKV